MKSLKSLLVGLLGIQLGLGSLLAQILVPMQNQNIPVSNGVRNLRLLSQSADGTEATLLMEYSYNGLSGGSARLLPVIATKNGEKVSSWFGADPVTIPTGRGTISIKVKFFNDEPGTPKTLTTDRIRIAMLTDSGASVIAQSIFSQTVKWGEPPANATPDAEAVKAQEQARLKAEAERAAQVQAAQERAAAEAKVLAETQRRAEQARLEAEAKAKAAEVEAAHLKAEQERLAAEAKAAAERKADEERQIAEAKAKAEQERLAAIAKAQEEARVKAEQERIAAEAKAKAEAEARLKAEQEQQAAQARAKAEAEAKAQETARIQAEQERLAAEAREEARQKAEQDRLAAIAKAQEEARAKAEQERIAAEAKAQAEAAAKAREEARLKAEQDRLATEARNLEIARQKTKQDRLAAEARAKSAAEALAAAQAKAELAKSVPTPPATATPAFVLSQRHKSQVNNIDIVRRSLDRTEMTLSVEYDFSRNDGKVKMGVDVASTDDPSVANYFSSIPADLSRGKHGCLIPVKLAARAADAFHRPTLPTDKIWIYLIDHAGAKTYIYQGTMVLRWHIPGGGRSTPDTPSVAPAGPQNMAEIDSYKQDDLFGGYVIVKYNLIPARGHLHLRLYDSANPASADWFATDDIPLQSGPGMQVMKTFVPAVANSPDVFKIDTMEIQLMDDAGKTLASSQKTAPMTWAKRK